MRLAASQECVSYFTSQYRHQVYKQIHVDLLALVESVLTGQDFELLAMKGVLGNLSTRGFDERYYQEHKLAGLDYLGFGDWQRQYGRWMVDALGLQGKKVLDVGCACGAIVRGFGEAGAVVQGVDVNEHMIRLGREQWPDMAPLLTAVRVRCGEPTPFRGWLVGRDPFGTGRRALEAGTRAVDPARAASHR